MVDDEAPNPVFRPGGVSYLHLPALDPAASGAFYHRTFGWDVDDDPGSPRFADGTGHVIGRWVTDRPVAHGAGPLLYVYVESVDATLARAVEHGGSVLRPPYPEGDLTVAVLTDPAGNQVGVWQSGPA
jgi:predicted enzyme related to lactoylglutathione lyase